MEERIDRKDYTGYLSGVADGLNQGRQDTIKEFEKLKTKILQKAHIVGKENNEGVYVSLEREVFAVIDDCISELKGENK